MSVLSFDYSDAMILAGSIAQGMQEDNDFSFLGALTAGLGINVQFEETRLSILRILAISVAGYYTGKYIRDSKKQ